jgi:hypothetical protein
MTDIKLLTPSMREKVENFIHALDANGVKYRIIETKRTESTQRAYYAQGREPVAVVNIKRRSAGLGEITESENRNKITWTLESKHLVGRAIDIVPVIDGKIPWNINSKEIAAAYMRIGLIGEAAGLAWGGRWTPIDKFGIGKDAPHFEEA